MVTREQIQYVRMGIQALAFAIFGVTVAMTLPARATGPEATTVQVRPDCRYTYDVPDMPELKDDAEKACQADLIQSVDIRGSRADLSLTISYRVDMLNQQVANTPGGIAAGRAAWATWSFWHRERQIQKFSILFRDKFDRGLCWFTFDHAKSDDIPTVARCVQFVTDNGEGPAK